MHYDIWATAEDDPPSPDGDYVGRYATREGALAEARVLLKKGFSVEIVPVSEDAPLPGWAPSDPLDIPPFLRREAS